MRTSGPLAILAASLCTGCIGVSAKRLNPDGTIAPPRYCATGTAVAEDGLIDDFEDGDTRVAEIAGRGGYWWKSADSAGSKIGPDDFKPKPSGPGESLAMRAVGETVSGDPEEAWGAQFGANFTQQGLYDASKYVGIRFRAKIGEGSTPSVRFKLGDVNTHPNFGVCKSCWNHFGRDLSLSTEWQEFELFFASLTQAPYWGDPRPANVNHSKVYAFDFQFGPGQKFDIWIDDLAFIECR